MLAIPARRPRAPHGALADTPSVAPQHRLDSAASRAAEFRETVARGNGAPARIRRRTVSCTRSRVRYTRQCSQPSPAAVRKRDPKYAFGGFRQDEGPLWTLVFEERPLHLLNRAYSRLGMRSSRPLSRDDRYLQGNFERPVRQRARGRAQYARHAPIRCARRALAVVLDRHGELAHVGRRNVPSDQSSGETALRALRVAPGHEARRLLRDAGGQKRPPLFSVVPRGTRSLVPGEPRRSC